MAELPLRMLHLRHILDVYDCGCTGESWETQGVVLRHYLVACGHVNCRLRETGERGRGRSDVQRELWETENASPEATLHIAS